MADPNSELEALQRITRVVEDAVPTRRVASVNPTDPPGFVAAPTREYAHVFPVDTAGAYQAGDAVFSQIIPFVGATRGKGCSAVLTDFTVIDRIAQNPGFQLWFFDTDQITLAAANAQWSPSYADMLRCQGFITSGFSASVGSTARGTLDRFAIGKTVWSHRDDGTVFGVLVITAAATYTGKEDLLVRTSFQQN